MLDENLPTYRYKPSSDNPLNTILYFTHHGSDPAADYLLKRPTPSACQNKYAIGLLDVQYASVIYAEVLLEPEWTQPTLSAAEVRAQSGTPPAMATTPDNFAISLYNPDQAVTVRQNSGGWGKSDAWEFEMPERSFKRPSASQLDQDSAEPQVSELVPKVVFRWKRDGRLSRDMTCYMTGKSVAGKKSKEPDITIALFRGKHDSTLTIYEPNMARVDVEDRKGLEMVLLMSAEVIRDLYLNPRNDVFNTGGGMVPAHRRRTNSRPTASPPHAAAASGATMSGANMSGALGNVRPPSPPRAQQPAQPRPSPTNGTDPRRQAEIDAETRRLQEMVAQERRQVRERAKRDQEEQNRIKQMLEKEESDRRKREAEIEEETERLRQEYGVQGQSFGSTAGGPSSGPSNTASTRPSNGPSGGSPDLPPRPQFGAPDYGGWHGSNGGLSGRPPQPLRPSSVGPAPTSPHTHFAPPPQQPAQNGKKKHSLGGLLQGPYAGPAAASVSGFFGGRTEEEKRKRMQKKRSVQF